MSEVPPNYRTITFDSCYSCRHYGQSQTIEQGYCKQHKDDRGFKFDVTYGFLHICDDHEGEN